MASEEICKKCYNSNCVCKDCKEIGKLCEKDYPGSSEGCCFLSDQLGIKCFDKGDSI